MGRCSECSLHAGTLNLVQFKNFWNAGRRETPAFSEMGSRETQADF